MAQDPNEIENRYRKQLSVMRGWLEGRRYFKAFDAMELARSLESGTRKDGITPKFHHQLSVTRLVTTLAPHLLYPEETIAAAFLHDTVEDHGDQINVDVLRDRFGPDISKAVWTLSKKTYGLSKTYEVYFQGLAECPIGSIVKLADRAHNIQTMPGVFSPEKQRAYLDELNQWFFPMVKTARRRYPQQYGAYENLKILLRCQMSLIEQMLPGN